MRSSDFPSDIVLNCNYHAAIVSDILFGIIFIYLMACVFFMLDVIGFRESGNSERLRLD
jgi:hypothetical protein